MLQLDKTIGEEVKLICFADDGVICVEKDQRYYQKKPPGYKMCKISSNVIYQ